MKVSILGTEYEIILDAPDDMLPKNSDGAMDNSVKKIMVAKFESGDGTLKDLKEYQKKVLRHEILHAFLYESGVWCNSNTVESWGMNEEMIDWFAIQFSKILKAYEEARAL